MRLVSFGWGQGVRVIQLDEFSDTDINFDAGNVDVSQVDRLIVNVSACQLTIVEGAKFSVTGHYRGSESSFDCSIDGNTFRVNLYQNRSSIYNFGWQSLWFIGQNWRAPEVTITIPSGTTFRDVAISCDAADVDLCSITADSIAIIANAVSINSRAIDCDNLSIEINAGYTSLSNVTVRRAANINASAGDININRADITNLNLELNFGSVNYFGTMSGTNKLYTASGDMKITLEQPENDFDISYSASVGDMTINSRSFSGLDSNGTAGNRNADIKLDITLEFGSFTLKTR